MAYSIQGRISYILEANSKRPNDFSLIGRKTNEILQFNDSHMGELDSVQKFIEIQGFSYVYTIN